MFSRLTGELRLLLPPYGYAMLVTVLLAHPRTESFNHAIADTVVQALAAAGHQVSFHDLYAENFDPILQADECFSIGKAIEDLHTPSATGLVAHYRSEIAEADGLVVVHPNWWGKPPAILAGWLDRVLIPGVAYRLAEASGEPEGLLRLQSALVITTGDTPAEREALLGDPLSQIWTRCVLPFCGDPTVDRLHFGPTTDSSDDQRADWLSAAADHASTLFETVPGAG